MRKQLLLSILAIALPILSLLAQPQRIITLLPSISKQIDLLGVKHLLVGRSGYCEIDGMDHIPVVSSYYSLHKEKIYTLKPDLILTTSLTSEKSIRSLQALGLKVKVFPTPKDFKTLCEQFIELGNLCGVGENARRIVQQQKQRLSELQEKIPANRPHLNIFLQIDMNPLWAATPIAFPHDYIVCVGAKNIFEDARLGKVSKEVVIARNPDAIICFDRHGPSKGATGGTIWQAFPHLKAVKNSKILEISNSKAASPTPVSFVDVVETIIHFLY